ncbi:GNAT family N-acetyltransferase [Rhizobium sp. P44RR-XXIV]|uniref:GNAT family N-acetyltransferase n=1 Tax=Rhizobium sp. P44RR-XXIV TaxID=1921145 RepID=UPI000984219E|nr:GNAT family N-acetyltransferase [Rhizobium sp. P44RR-XXIV]TIX89923.1 GNAT family N-acetyltransferase [Rhizobium sp. P44RR-XXIV]
MNFRHIENAEDIAESFAVMRELRPHIEDPDIYRERVQRQQQDGYRLLGVWQDGALSGLAGYRHLENLIYGRFTYVDDLVVRQSCQRSRFGAELIDHVRELAKADGRAMLVLDTGLGNSLAQRFYFRNGLLARGLHFSQVLKEASA